MSLNHAARDAHAAGLCVIPAATTGTKQPYPDGPSWKRYTTERPTIDQLDAWFGGGRYDGMGLVCGAISGNLEMLEFEGRAVAEKVTQEFSEIAEASGLGDLWRRVTTGYAETTPSGGIHLLYRVEGDVAGNTKLASRPATTEELVENPKDKVKVLIETRGEGGFVIAAPSGGRTHENGGTWTLVAGSFTAIATLTPAERDALHHLAGALDQMPAAEQATPQQPGFSQPGQADDSTRPGIDFNERATWDDIIGVRGWTRLYAGSTGTTWRRPGKRMGVSATTGRGGMDNLYVFSTSTEFEAERPYDKFGAITHLEHGGNFSAAASALRAQGYGSQSAGGGSHTPPRANSTPTEDGESGNVDEQGQRRIDLTYEDRAVLAIRDAVNGGSIPGLYIRNGDVAQVRELDDGGRTRLVIPTVTADGLRMLLAEHTTCYRLKATKDDVKELPGLPSVAAAKAVLSNIEWPNVPILAGVIATPVIRPDGSVLTAAGYDPGTRLYHKPAVHVPDVPEQPNEFEVAQAKAFVLDHVLADFCFDSDASRANFLALLITPLMRLYVGGLRPLAVISATTRGAGKSLLTEILRALYGMRMNPWVQRDEEMTKTITSLLRDTTEPVVCFDNVGTFDAVDHASLAMLLTASEWSSRILGVNAVYSGINDRTWCVTGNNVRVGGDVASRSVLVRLDPNEERPEERTGFVIADMWSWLDKPANQADLFRALLILVRAWIAAGAPLQDGVQMRNFSKWAQTMGGLVDFYGVPGFLDNRGELAADFDEEETSTAAFLAQWLHKFRRASKPEESTPKKSTDLIESTRASSNGMSFTSADPWDGTFPAKADGSAFSAKGLGRYLTARRGRIFAGIKLVGVLDKGKNVWLYHVEQVESDQAGAEAA